MCRSIRCRDHSYNTDGHTTQRNVKTIQLYLLGSALLVFWTDDVNLIMLVPYRPLVHVNDVISVGNQESENIRVQLC